MKLAVTLAAVLAAALSPLAVVPAATAADPAPITVDWPAVTRFNPTVTSYSATVTNNDPSRYLFSTFGPANRVYDAWSASPVDGTVTLGPETNDSGIIQIWSCQQNFLAVGNGTCSVVATSPALAVYSRIAVQNVDWTMPTLKAGVYRHRISYAPKPPEVATPSATWELLDDQGRPLATPVRGTLADADLALDADGFANVPFAVPASLPNGNYKLDVRLSLDTTDFGLLQGSLSNGAAGGGYALDVRVDNTTPRLTVGRYTSTLYPARDGYLDGVWLSVDTTETTLSTFEVFNASGVRVVRRDEGWLISGTGNTVAWDGRNALGNMVAAGTYTLKLTATDQAGNPGTWTGRVTVSHKRLQWVTYTRTVQAAPYVVSKSVGGCSTLARKRHGVLGFYSQTKCTNPDRSVVAAQFGIYIPKAFQNHYQWAQVTLNGGPATRSAKNYIVFAYVQPRTGAWLGRTEFHAGTGAHTAPRLDISSRNVFDRATSKPYLIWASGLTDGSRYNVRSYTAKVRYQVLK